MMQLKYAMAIVLPMFSASPFLAAQNLIIGSDLNSTANELVQPQDDALSGGGRDQSQQFGDILSGGSNTDVIFGGLGTDVIFGNKGDDVIAGGTEDFNPFNRDRAFGGDGDDVFLWAPGDGSDFFDGGPGNSDTLILGLIGELDEEGNEVFQIQNDQNFDKPLLSKHKLPVIDVAGSPGFCDLIEANSKSNKKALKELNLDHLVRFSIRGIANQFENGENSEDNGLRVTIHLKNTEFVVCASREGGEVEVLDLRSVPAQLASVDDLPLQTQKLLRSFKEDQGNDYEKIYSKKKYNSDYYANGERYRTQVYFDGKDGWFQTSFSRGKFYNVRYAKNRVWGRWQNQGVHGWFDFEYYNNHQSFKGYWGKGENGTPAQGEWNGKLPSGNGDY